MTHTEYYVEYASGSSLTRPSFYMDLDFLDDIIQVKFRYVDDISKHYELGKEVMPSGTPNLDKPVIFAKRIKDGQTVFDIWFFTRRITWYPRNKGCGGKHF